MTDRDTLRAVMDRMNAPDPFEVTLQILRLGLEKARDMETRLRLIQEVASRAASQHPRSRTAHQMLYIEEMASGGLSND